MNMCIYHATAKSYTLPLDNRGTPIIVLLLFVLSVFVHIIMIYLIKCSLLAE